MSIRILIADDHAMFREGLQVLLERELDMTVIAGAEDGQTAVNLTLELMPDVVILDINMSGLNGIEAARIIRERAEKVGIILLTMHNDKHYLIEALKLGVRSYILKDWACEELVIAVRSVFNGASYLSPRLSDIIISGLAGTGSASPQSTLTARELQAFRLLAGGKNCKEIAYELRISCKTVETYRLQVMKKLNVSNMAQLTLYAIQEGIMVRSK